MKACRDCKHVEIGSMSHKCRHPKGVVEIPLFFEGTIKTIALSIDHMRTIGECGTEAVLFEPKEPGDNDRHQGGTLKCVIKRPNNT